MALKLTMELLPTYIKVCKMKGQQEGKVLSVFIREIVLWHGKRAMIKRI